MPNQVKQTLEQIAKHNYLTDQLMTVSPLPPAKCGQFKIKIVSNAGETNWLNITPEQFEAIDRIISPE